MDIQKINKAFQYLTMQTNQWIEQGFTPTIEKDLALKKLQEIYQDLIEDQFNTREITANPQPQPQQIPYDNPYPAQQSNQMKFKPESETIVIFNQEISRNQVEIFTRELFWRDSSLFESEIKTMESLKSLDSAMIYITEKYNWSPANQYANQFVEILEKYY